MTQTNPTALSASGLVRVSVSSGTRRVDLVLPGSVPVAELVPELARSVGLLDAATVYGGYRVVTSAGRELDAEQRTGRPGRGGRRAAHRHRGRRRADRRVIYDDIVEAMTDVVERDLEPWSPASGRRTALTAAGAADGARRGAALAVQYDSLLAGVAAGVVAVDAGRGGHRPVPGPARARGRRRRSPGWAPGTPTLGAADARPPGRAAVLRDRAGVRRGGCTGGGARLRGGSRRRPRPHHPTGGGRVRSRWRPG